MVFCFYRATNKRAGKPGNAFVETLDNYREFIVPATGLVPWLAFFGNAEMKNSHHLSNNNGFQCAHCHYFVSSDPMIAGVKNRNHCPYCLWSRHVDLFEAGDRLAVCKARMQPIGLTLKRTRKKYGLAQYGELMLIHQCEDCGKVSVNRIAADDDAALLFDIFKGSFHLESQIKNMLAADGIHALDSGDGYIVHASLFGRS